MQILGLLLIILAAIIHCISAVSMCRWKNFTQQIHASSLGETIAPLLTLLGVGLLSANYLTGLKLLFLGILLLLIGPLTSHNLANLDSSLKQENKGGK